LYVWIDSIDPFEAYVFSQPLLTLLKEPEIFSNKSVFNNKYSYIQVINMLKKDMGRPKIEKELWNMLCKHTAHSLVVIAPKLNKNGNSQHLLEFQYILQSVSLKPWLFNINTNVDFHPTLEEEGDLTHTDSPDLTLLKSKTTIAHYKDTLLTCILHKIFDMIERRLLFIKSKEKGNVKEDRCNK
jgi:hypothetical protein